MAVDPLLESKVPVSRRDEHLVVSETFGLVHRDSVIALDLPGISSPWTFCIVRL